jgi:3-deoxy-manno-octulosonate cytidylyltransferase (CMP-KDO synthetase)
MIWYVYERCRQIEGLDGVYVATDSPEIKGAVEKFGGQVIMTASSHRSGTDRLAEASLKLSLKSEDLVINVQGDQPLLDPKHPSLLIETLFDGDPRCQMATLAVPMTDPAEIRDPNHVKVVVDQDFNALYFSRAPIPWPRDGGKSSFLKHIGLYAYRVEFLRLFVSWPPGVLEEIEKLEQLRALERGALIRVVTSEGRSPEVDVPADVAIIESILASNPLASNPILAEAEPKKTKPTEQKNPKNPKGSKDK